jgi:hypothetical protein
MQGQLAQPSSPWEEVTDKRTGQLYYWNRQTGGHAWLFAGHECNHTSPGTQGRAGLLCEFADETTAVGEPKPGPEGRVQQWQAHVAVNSGTSLLGLVGMGAGVGLVFAILGRIF